MVDKNQKLIGTITDGDVRRALLRGETLDTTVDKMMCTEFRSLPSNATEDQAIAMRHEVLHQVPSLDEQGRVVRLFLLEELIKSRGEAILWRVEKESASFRSQRIVQPMLRVGECRCSRYLEQLVDAGFQNFYLSVNYLKHQIIDYFGDGERWGVQIGYIEEEKPLGTVGALSLLPKTLSQC